MPKAIKATESPSGAEAVKSYLSYEIRAEAQRAEERELNKLTEIKQSYEEEESWKTNLPNSKEQTLHERIDYLLSLLEEKDKALHGQHRYFERISVTFGEFECQRLAKEAMEKYTSSNNEGE